MAVMHQGLQWRYSLYLCSPETLPCVMRTILDKPEANRLKDGESERKVR